MYIRTLLELSLESAAAAVGDGDCSSRGLDSVDLAISHPHTLTERENVSLCMSPYRPVCVCVFVCLTGFVSKLSLSLETDGERDSSKLMVKSDLS